MWLELARGAAAAAPSDAPVRPGGCGAPPAGRPPPPSAAACPALDGGDDGGGGGDALPPGVVGFDRGAAVHGTPLQVAERTLDRLRRRVARAREQRAAAEARDRVAVKEAEAAVRAARRSSRG